MRNTDNGVIGSDQTAVMAWLALDELIDQLLHSNALSLKLTANPLVADRARHLTENTCIRAFSADDPQAKKSVRTTRCSFSISPGLPTRSRQRLPISFIRCFPGSEITSSLSGCGRKANASTTRDQCLTPAISSTNCAPYASSTRRLIIRCSISLPARPLRRKSTISSKATAPSICFSSIWWRWGWWARCRKPALRLRKICGMR